MVQEPRASVRAIILDENDHLLLCRFIVPHPAVPNGVTAVWAAPGGGIEAGEDHLAALRRELREETGLHVEADPPHVWHQVVPAAEAGGSRGFVNDYFLVRTARFEPLGYFDTETLAAEENLTEFRWWEPSDVAASSGPDVFSPRNLAVQLDDLLRSGAPAAPIRLGL